MTGLSFPSESRKYRRAWSFWMPGSPEEHRLPWSPECAPLCPSSGTWSRRIPCAEHRGWRDLHILSSATNDYNRCYFAENEQGMQMPTANDFVKRDGSIYHTRGSELLHADVDAQPRHMDLMWPL